MIIDTHCHFDMMPNPEAYIKDAENRGNIIIGMTNLPSHFQIGHRYLKDFRHVRLALGFHPQLAAESTKELALFSRLVNNTSYIGEIGLDFSKNDYRSNGLQIENLHYILSVLKGKKKIISIHSRNAEKEVLKLLEEYEIQNVIFHWYSGPVNLIPDIVDRGYYFSINEAMTLAFGGQKIIKAVPMERLLTESDAPFNRLCSIHNVLKYVGITEIDIKQNFMSLIKNLS